MLEMRNVTAGYDGTTVLRDVTLRVKSGQVVALLGPNGAGKSTLLRVASRQLNPWKGELLLGGADISRLSCERLASQRVCLIPEGRSIFPSLTVRENILTFARRSTEDPLDVVTGEF